MMDSLRLNSLRHATSGADRSLGTCVTARRTPRLRSLSFSSALYARPSYLRQAMECLREIRVPSVCASSDDGSRHSAESVIVSSASDRLEQRILRAALGSPLWAERSIGSSSCRARLSMHLAIATYAPPSGSALSAISIVDQSVRRGHVD